MLRAERDSLTVHDYRELPEGPPYYQLIEGDLYKAPSANIFHQDILGNLYLILREYLKKHPVGKVVLAPSDVRLTDLNVYQPDLYFVSNARRSIFSKQGAEDAPEDAPDLVVEILSPNTAKLDKGVKREVYARTGVAELWLVDPDLKRVQVYRFADSADAPAGSYRVHQKFSSPLFAGLKISVARIFEA